MKKFYNIKEKNPVILVKGQKSFYKIVRELKPPKKSNYLLKWSSEFNPEWVRSHEMNLKKGMDIKFLSRYDNETEKEVKKWLKVTKNIRKFNNDGVAFSIVDNEEIMIMLIKSNVTLLIKDKPFVKIMKKMFLETYKNAEKLK